MDKQRIEELTAKSRLTQEEKNEITAAADAAGIEYKLKGNCRACYDKLLVKLYEAAGGESKTEAKTTANVSKDGWRLKNPAQSFRLFGVLWDNETIKERNVANLNPFVRSTYFVKTTK